MSTKDELMQAAAKLRKSSDIEFQSAKDAEKKLNEAKQEAQTAHNKGDSAPQKDQIVQGREKDYKDALSGAEDLKKQAEQMEAQARIFE